MAPCFLLLDNLEIILGSGTEGAVRGAGTNKRTAHQALDRLLSTLLVEIDGLSSSRTLSNVGSSKNGDMRSGGVAKDTEWRPVVVIATTCDMGLIDR
jgi:SpoVK/Ycf46/Vps4 family AAA+-type ATPase